MKKLILGVSAGVFYSILSMGISLLSVPYFLKFVSKEELGIYFLINNLIIWSGILNFGLRGSFKHQLSVTIGKGEKPNSLISTMLVSQCFVVFSILLLGIVFTFSAPYLLSDLFEKIGPDLQQLIFLLTVSFAISLLSNPFVTIFSVYNRDSLVFSLKSIFLLAQTCLSIYFLNMGYSIISFAFSSLLFEILFLFMVFYHFKSKLFIDKIHITAFDKQLFKASLTTGKWFLAGFLAQLFIRHTDLFLIKEFVGLEIITAYIMSSKLYFLVTTLVVMYFKVISPQLTKLIHSKASSNEWIMIFIKGSLGIIIISGILIYFINEPFVTMWVGKEFFLSGKTNFILLITFLLSSVNFCIRAILMAQTKIKLQKISALSEGIIHVLLASSLGYLFQLQGIIIGVFISTAIASIINYNILLSDYTFTRENKQDLSLIALYIGALSLLLFFLPASNFIINWIFMGLLLVSYYFISYNEVQQILKSVRTR